MSVSTVENTTPVTVATEQTSVSNAPDVSEVSTKPTPKLTFYYFHIEGRSAGIRMMLKLTKLPHTFVEFNQQEWASKFKGQMPFGSVPVVEIQEEGSKEKQVLWQSNAILRYLAQQGGFWNYESLYEENRALAIMMSAEDLMTKLAIINHSWLLSKVYQIISFTAKGAGFSEFTERFAKQVRGKFFFGDELGAPDIAVYSIYKMLLGLPKVDAKVLPRITENPKFYQWFKNVESHPIVEEYLQSTGKPTIQ